MRSPRETVSLLHVSRASLWIATFALAAAVGCNDSSSSGGGGGSGMPPGTPGTATVSVVSVTPSDGANDVATSAAVQIEFSADVDAATVTAANFQVSGSVTGLVAGAYAYDGTNFVATFTPDEEFAFGETIAVDLTTDIKAADGGAFDGFMSSFTIEASPPLPANLVTIESASPERAAQGVDANAEVNVLLSDSVVPSSVNVATAWLNSSLTGRVAAQLVLMDSSRRIRMFPSRPFRAGEVITVHLSALIEPADAAQVFVGESFRFRVASAATDLTNARRSVTSAVTTIKELLSGDFNLDDHLDLAYLTDGGREIHFLLGDGSGDFPGRARVGFPMELLSIATGDLDVDGDVDFIVGTLTGVATATNLAAQQNVAGDEVRFTPSSEVILGSAVRGIVAGDIDFLGDLDYVLDTDAGLEVRLGSLASNSVQVLGASRQAASPLRLDDLNLDGQVDLVYGAATGTRLAYRLGRLPDVNGGQGGNDATNPFGPERSVEIGHGVEDLLVENLDSNATPEILVLTTAGATLEGGALRILTRNEVGGYEVEELVGPAPEAGGDGDGQGASLDTGRLALADFEGDAALDPIVSSALNERVVWIPHQSGAPLLQQGEELLRAPVALSVIAGDFTANGATEIYAAALNEVHGLIVRDDVPPPADTFHLRVVGSEARRGQASAAALLRATSSSPMDGYSLIVGYDPAVLSPQSASFVGTETESAAADFTRFQLRAGDSAVTVEAVVDVSAAVRTIPPINDAALCRLLFTVQPDAALGDSSLTLVDTLASVPAISTRFVVGSDTITPTLEDGELTIVSGDEPNGGENPNKMRAGDAAIAAGTSGLVPIFGTAEENVDAFTTILGFDPDFLDFEDVDLTGSATEPLNPEFTFLRRAPEGDHFTYTVIFDFNPPFDRQAIPAGDDFLLFSARFAVKRSTPTGAYPVMFLDGVGDPALFNIFAFGGQSILVDTQNGVIEVEGTGETFFIRGDANVDGVVDLDDSGVINAFVFGESDSVPCRDAVDVNDDGELSVSDATFFLRFFLQGDVEPPAPFPDPGMDPTEDSLDCEQGI